MSDPANDFGDFMQQIGRVKVAPRYADPPRPTPPEGTDAPLVADRDALHAALRLVLDKARIVREEDAGPNVIAVAIHLSRAEWEHAVAALGGYPHGREEDPR